MVILCKIIIIIQELSAAPSKVDQPTYQDLYQKQYNQPFYLSTDTIQDNETLAIYDFLVWYTYKTKALVKKLDITKLITTLRIKGANFSCRLHISMECGLFSFQQIYDIRFYMNIYKATNGLALPMHAGKTLDTLRK